MKVVSYSSFCLGLTLHESPEDMQDGKVLGVSDHLYKKGCVEEVNQGVQVESCKILPRGEGRGS